VQDGRGFAAGGAVDVWSGLECGWRREKGEMVPIIARRYFPLRVALVRPMTGAFCVTVWMDESVLVCVNLEE
jgi:hypothetical protein